MISAEYNTVDFPKLVTKSGLVGNRGLHGQKMILPEWLTAKLPNCHFFNKFLWYKLFKNGKISNKHHFEQGEGLYGLL